MTRALFLNENIGGHRAMHLYLRQSLVSLPDVKATFVDIPPPGLVRKLVGAHIPGLARLDADLQPLRYQLAQSAHARRLVGDLLGEVDVVHVYSQNAALLLSRRLSRVPTVVSTDSTNMQNAYTLPYRKATAWTGRMLPVTKRFERPVFAAATLVVAQSEWAAASAVDDYGVDADRIRIVRFGMPPGPPPARVETDVPEVTFVGTSMTRKGGWRLLDVYRRTLRGRAVLNLVTHDHVEPEPGVRVYGDINPGDGRLAEVLARTAVFAFPSEIDKSSFAVIEAMAAGVPPVVGRTGGLAEIVEDGVSGLVVDPTDDGAWDDALAKLIDDADLRRRLGAQARLRVEREFDSDRTTRQLVTVLEEAISRFAADQRPQRGRLRRRPAAARP